MVSLGVLAAARESGSGWQDTVELLGTDHGDQTVSRVEKALRSLEVRLNDVGPTPALVQPVAPPTKQEIVTSAPALSESDISDNDVVMHAAPESTGQEKPLYPVHASEEHGKEWSAQDQEGYDAEMHRALGFAGPLPEEDHMPAMFLPLASLPLQRNYARNLVSVLQNMKEGYIEELIQWATSGNKGENPFILPVVETLEAPLIKDLDKEAHLKVEATVARVAKNKNLSAAQMKSMRARLLVPLLLRIRARVHQQVQTYVISMLRRIILYSTKWDKKDNFNTHGILAPDSGPAPEASDDEHMEYTLRDIDALYEKGILSERDYQAEKAKLLSEWLGLAIKNIGGKRRARKALHDFLWPPIMTVKGCHCMVPFEFTVDQLGSKKKITYNECTDIPNPDMVNATGIATVPGPGWCAVDPDDGNCGHNSSDPLAFIGPGGYDWDHWDVCVQQPPPRPEDGIVPVDKEVHVLTERGCTCQLPFEVYPLMLGGRIKRTYTVCTTTGGDGADWCATVGDCGRPGTPQGVGTGHGLTWTHWDKCIGEPAGFLASPHKKIRTKQGCYCRDSWTFQPHYFAKPVAYGGCTDIDSPGTAWCAVEGDSCGEVSQDPLAGDKGYGWTHWVLPPPISFLPLFLPLMRCHAVRVRRQSRYAGLNAT